MATEVNYTSPMNLYTATDFGAQRRWNDYMKLSDTSFRWSSIVSDPSCNDAESCAVTVPFWSIQDKSERIVVEPSISLQMLRTNIPITVVYITVLIIMLSQDNTETLQEVSIGILLAFIFMQTIATAAQAVPDNASDTARLDARTTAIIFLSMVLYPCLGLWVMEHDKAWELPGVSNLWNIMDAGGNYTWGYVFPFFMWGLSAVMIMRGAYSSFSQDTFGVVTGEDGKPTTQLYRVIPGTLEVFIAKLCRVLTITPWHFLGDSSRPASGSGRFFFQLLGPAPLIFMYIGYRFCGYSIDQLKEATEIGPYGEFARTSDNASSDVVLRGRLLVWSAFFVHTIFLRALLPTHFFLEQFIEDKQSLNHRWIGWPNHVAPSKRTRLLWGFRGWTLAFVPYYLQKTSMSPSDESSFRVFLWVLYIMQLVSYLMEGVLALFWGLNEAARSCHLHLPFQKGVSIFFWLSYNAYLQPLGTTINVMLYLASQERQKGVVLAEVWGPLVVRGVFRQWVVKLFDFSFCSSVACMSCSSHKSEVEEKTLDGANNLIVDRRVEEWLDTWRRKRLEVGKPIDNFKIVKRPSGDDAVREADDEPGQVFFGTVFPTYEEYLYMRDNPEDYIDSDFWHDDHPERKFMSWYPTYAEEVVGLLKEPYNFDVKREIWMFGYGSLLSPDTPPAGLTARQRKMLLPYWLKKTSGYKNSFSFRHGSCSINALGLVPAEEGEPGHHVCGCVYPINYEVACDLFCYREDGYEFSLVAVEHFKAMHPAYQIPEGVGYIWMCGAPTQTCGDRFNNECDDWYCKLHVATKDSPILQTYVDSIMTGALRYATSGPGQEDGMNFCAAILTTIQDWDHPWYNDRVISGRPWIWRQEWQIIDGLLNTCPNTSRAFAKRLGPMLTQPTRPRQSMIVKDRERYANWAEQFYSGKRAPQKKTVSKVPRTTSMRRIQQKPLSDKDLETTTKTRLSRIIDTSEGLEGDKSKSEFRLFSYSNATDDGVEKKSVSTVPWTISARKIQQKASSDKDLETAKRKRLSRILDVSEGLEEDKSRSELMVFSYSNSSDDEDPELALSGPPPYGQGRF